MCTLAEFLINNEGKRCVVVLDVRLLFLFNHCPKLIHALQEIEKTRDEKTLWSLLMPWELGRCTLEANGRPVDCRNVVWIGTSNVGHDLVLEHHQARLQPDLPVTREEYVDLMGLLRPRVSQRLGVRFHIIDEPCDPSRY
jgi:ATP-dependent Clp protease ATP-binding subunit ClpA